MERPTPRVFHYSLDWRFLLPIADPGKFLIVFEDNSDFSQTLEQAGIPPANQLTFSALGKKVEQKAQSIVLPFGLPLDGLGARQADQIKFFHSLRQEIEPGGCLLLGFKNAWSYRSHAQSEYCSSTPRRVANQLKQAGFKSSRFFGAFPNLDIPEYIFELNAGTLRFALDHRFRRKPVLWQALQVLSRAVGWNSISTLLPYYFVIAAN